MKASGIDVGRVTSPGGIGMMEDYRAPVSKRLRRLERVWINEGNPVYFLTVCIHGRKNRLAFTAVHDRLVQFLIDSPERYGWLPGRYVLMPDHLHLLVTQGIAKARRVDGDQRSETAATVERRVGSPGLQRRKIRRSETAATAERRVVPHLLDGLQRKEGLLAQVEVAQPSIDLRQGCRPGDLIRRNQPVSLGSWIKALKSFVGERKIKWQNSFFDHVLRHEESAIRKWEYIRLNPVRAGLVKEPEDWTFAGELDWQTAPGGVTRPTTEKDSAVRDRRYSGTTGGPAFAGRPTTG
jgi:REP element-mobilizing transposase RayT